MMRTREEMEARIHSLRRTGDQENSSVLANVRWALGVSYPGKVMGHNAWVADDGSVELTTYVREAEDSAYVVSHLFGVDDPTSWTSRLEPIPSSVFDSGS